MISSVLTIVAAASDLALLSAAELRAAAGLGSEDRSQDAALTSLGLEAAEWIATLCDVRVNGSVPTLKEESLSEAFRLREGGFGSYGWTSTYYPPPGSLILARRFVSAVAVTENGAALTEGTDFLVHAESGLVDRLANDHVTWWPCGTIVVAYTAGLAVVPAVLKAVATDFVRLRLSQRGRDPLVQSERTEGVDSVTYRDGAVGEADFETASRARLSRFMNRTIG